MFARILVSPMIPSGRKARWRHSRRSRAILPTRWGAGRRTFSFIRTVTVGSGLAPDLLDPSHGRRSRARSKAAYRRWGVSPRPENNPQNKAKQRSWQLERRLVRWNQRRRSNDLMEHRIYPETGSHFRVRCSGAECVQIESSFALSLFQCMVLSEKSVNFSGPCCGAMFTRRSLRKQAVQPLCV